MNELQEILKQTQKILSCPICKKKYQFNEIKLIGFLGGLYFFQVECQKNHSAIIMNIIISKNPIDFRESENPMPVNEAINMQKLSKSIEEFDGDFEKLWKR